MTFAKSYFDFKIKSSNNIHNVTEFRIDFY